MTAAAQKSPTHPPAVQGRSFKLALVQLGETSQDKSVNLARAKSLVLEAAKGKDGSGSVDLIVLPECFNSLYGTQHFDTYAESISGENGEGGDSTKLLHELAKTTGRWLIGGSIPERDAAGKLYNTSTVWNPEGRMVAKYRKMHLFDVDIPGGITFQESETLTGGNDLLTFETGAPVVPYLSEGSIREMPRVPRQVLHVVALTHVLSELACLHVGYLCIVYGSHFCDIDVPQILVFLSCRGWTTCRLPASIPASIDYEPAITVRERLARQFEDDLQLLFS